MFLYCFSDVPVDTELFPIVLTEIVHKCAHRMMEIGMCLKITPQKIEIIQASQHGLTNQFLSMITLWSQKDHGTGPTDQPRTAQHLYDAVTKVGFPDEAKAFKAKVAEQQKEDMN